MPFGRALALVDLDRVAPFDSLDGFALPPCPVIGIGSSEHPLAALLDAVVEAPVSLEALVANVVARPLAAAVVVELMRLLPCLSLEDGLVAESLAYGLLQGSGEHLAWLRGRELVEASGPGRLEVSRQGNVLRAVIDRPWAGNAIDRALRDALDEMFTLAVLDREIERVELRGRGRTFSLGADLAEFGTTGDPATAHAIRRHSLPARVIAACADRLQVHVDGACVGSALEMAAFAAKVTASPAAWFHLPELAMGVLPGAGGCVSLTRRIGRQRAALMILSGKRISARVALDWGLVDAIDEGGGDADGG